MDKNESISVVVGGDFVPAGAGVPLFETGNATELVGEDLLAIIHEADFSVFNLEVPLTDKRSPIAKCGPNLIAPIATMTGLRAVNPGLFALANNHILDQGNQGLDSTLTVLDAVGASHFGAGANLAEAAKPFVFEKNGVRIGFYACTEHEFTIACDDAPGANPFDPLESLDHVAVLKAQCDYVVVLYHGGKEHYRYPSPMLQKTCRKLVEKGVDLVVCQHSHCIGCVEEYEGATIVYGQGNFLFDYDDNEFWRTSLLLRVSFATSSDCNFEIEYLPLRKQGVGVRLAQGDDSVEILETFRVRSERVQHPNVVREEYAQFADNMLDDYLNSFTLGSRTFLFRAINKLMGGKLTRKLTKRHRMLGEVNFLECEAHRELFLKGLKDEINLSVSSKSK